MPESSSPNSADPHAVPPDECLTTAKEGPQGEATPAVDDLHRLAMPLAPDEKLRLVARLWKSLPQEHRAALLTLQLEDQRDDGQTFGVARPPQIDSLWPKIYTVLFDPTNVSELYSAPRRFDLATIFVVTAAYSLLLGGLSALDALPIIKVIISVMVAIVATTQALFLPVANPRGVSIVTGAVAYTIISFIIWFSIRGVFPNSFFFVTFINGIVGGSILGYLVGTVVGGVFLVADKVRTRYEGKKESDAAEAVPAAGSTPSEPPS